MRIIVIGGGAAGFFGAVNTARQFPAARVTILEKSDKLLAKVRVSGGGRCNVTHDCDENALLVKNYPRGERQLMSVFSRFTVKDTIAWYAQRGVDLKIEEDGRMFPVTDSSQSIIDCLLTEARKYNVQIKTGTGVKGIRRGEGGFELDLENGGQIQADRILIATGGNAKPLAYAWLAALGHTIVPPVPSLFTFNLPGDKITALMGVSADPVRISITGTRFESIGPVLITHWGMSGPAVLRLSSLAARELNGSNYDARITVNWLGEMNGEEVKETLDAFRKSNAVRLVTGAGPFDLPKRLWEYLVLKSGCGPGIKWAELSNKLLSGLVRLLTSDEYHMQGKTTFKEEFVTCGGVSLNEVDLRTMESKVVPGLYFAGEVLDIDGITGGFNFQAAWSTAWVASQQLGG